jgi:hypothetical protein
VFRASARAPDRRCGSIRLSILPSWLIGIVVLLRLRILLLTGIVVLLRLRILLLSGIVVLLRLRILLLSGIVVLLRWWILPLAGIAVGTRDPGTILIVRAVGAGLRRGNRSVRITWVISIAGAVDVDGGIISVPIRNAITGVNASAVKSAIDRPPVRAWGERVTAPSVVSAGDRKALSPGITAFAGRTPRSVVAATAGKTLTAVTSHGSSGGATAPGSRPTTAILGQADCRYRSRQQRANHKGGRCDSLEHTRRSPFSLTS